MKKNYNSRKANGQKKNNVSRPFDGKIRQLKRETLILVNLTEAVPFIEECAKRKIRVKTGDTYNGGIIVYENK